MTPKCFICGKSEFKDQEVFVILNGDPVIYCKKHETDFLPLRDDITHLIGYIRAIASQHPFLHPAEINMAATAFHYNKFSQKTKERIEKK